ncbi:hypothetical protein NDU88_001568 [Pleurodeles waltl]|uniref:Uncharacterized protein n=1 Tax=Pleurodeles waltl TaxID=8319 RepID=A0AAV7RAR2_PLEWA|nr:hypothetical protein NDU88_001568 [Pleurodeles waltl]
MAGTHVPDGEEDEGGAQHQGQHVTESSEGESHGGREAPGRTPHTVTTPRKATPPRMEQVQPAPPRPSLPNRLSKILGASISQEKICRSENVLILFSSTQRKANSLFFDRIQTLHVLRSLGRLGLLFSSLSHSGMDFPRLSPPHVYAGRWSAPGSPREFGGKSPPGAPKVRRERVGEKPATSKTGTCREGKVPVRAPKCGK